MTSSGGQRIALHPPWLQFPFCVIDYKVLNAFKEFDVSDQDRATVPVANKPDWVADRVKRAQEAKAVPDKTTTVLQQAMRGPMMERVLPNGDLTRLAKALIETLKDEQK
jgi:hypothetical protein